MDIKRFAIIVAGGSGTRMKMDIPKQFIELDGIPILMRTIIAFTQVVPKPTIIVVLPENQIETWKLLCLKYHFDEEHAVVVGGETRFHSVSNGLKAIKCEQDSLVAIHDGVRPLIRPSIIEASFGAAQLHGSAIPVIKPVESVRVADAESSKAFPRDRVMLVQTPQTFKTNLVKSAYLQEYNPSFTDDASVVESAGVSIFTIEGDKRNIKITTPLDCELALFLLNKAK